MALFFLVTTISLTLWNIPTNSGQLVGLVGLLLAWCFLCALWSSKSNAGSHVWYTSLIDTEAISLVALDWLEGSLLVTLGNVLAKEMTITSSSHAWT
jgi:hypothetical protein